jgi:hypothetical protein
MQHVRQSDKLHICRLRRHHKQDVRVRGDLPASADGAVLRSKDVRISAGGEHAEPNPVGREGVAAVAANRAGRGAEIRGRRTEGS